MKYEHILRAVFSEPWLITAESHAAIREIVKTHLLDPQAAQRKGEGVSGGEINLESMVIEDGVAIIPVGGVMGRKLTGFEKGSGAVDTLDIATDIREAAENPDVHTLLFDIDSPGGMVNGTPELASMIAGVSKRKFAYTAAMCASAAYWVAAAADQIWAAPSAVVGSIGVYLPSYDVTGMYQQQGVKVDLFRDGKFKGMGFPGTSLTPEQKQMLQARVEEIGTQFRGWIRERRGDIDNEDMQGQTFSAQVAQNKGLIDAITDDWRTTLAQVRRK